MANIPSDEDFKRADKLDAERNRGLDQVAEKVKRSISKIAPLHEFYIMPDREATFRGFVFFNTNSDLEACKVNGVVQQLIDATYNELGLVGRGSKKDVTVAFELDSHENVLRDFNGNYYNRLL